MAEDFLFCYCMLGNKVTNAYALLRLKTIVGIRKKNFSSFSMNRAEENKDRKGKKKIK